MKHYLLLSILLISALFAKPSFAIERYFSLSGGAFLPKNTTTIDNNFKPVKISYDTGWSSGGTIGVAFDSGLRLENEFVYRQASIKGTPEDLWSLGWMVNAWWDIRNRSFVTPYFGGGVGFGRGQSASPGPLDNSKIDPAYQVGVGVDLRIKPGLSLDVGYRYFGIADISSGNGVGSFNPVGSALMVGLRVKF